jgi:hypothetical protein
LTTDANNENWIAVGCVTAPVIGFLMLFPVASLFDLMSWPTFHTWGMMHGGFLLAWPVTTVSSFAIAISIIKAVRRFSR